MMQPETGRAEARKSDLGKMPFAPPRAIRLLNRIGARLERVGACRNLLAVEAMMRQADPRRILDVHYTDLVEDPVGTIRQIYDHFGYLFDGQFEARIVEWLDTNPKEKHGVHRYALEDFGLTPERVDRHFADYCEAYGLASGS